MAHSFEELSKMTVADGLAIQLFASGFEQIGDILQ